MRVVLPTLALSLCAFAQTARSDFFAGAARAVGRQHDARGGESDRSPAREKSSRHPGALKTSRLLLLPVDAGRGDTTPKPPGGGILFGPSSISPIPRSPVCTEATIDPRGHSLADAEGYDKARQLWLERMESKPPSAAALGNAAKFFQLFDKELAERALQRALEIDPRNGEWHWRPGISMRSEFSVSTGWPSTGSRRRWTR